MYILACVTAEFLNIVSGQRHLFDVKDSCLTWKTLVWRERLLFDVVFWGSYRVLCGALQCAAVCCRVLQIVAVCCSVLQRRLLRRVSCDVQCVAVCCRVLQSVAECCSVLQRRLLRLVSCAAVCCTVLQCVLVCCSVVSRGSCRVLQSV